MGLFKYTSRITGRVLQNYNYKHLCDVHSFTSKYTLFEISLCQFKGFQRTCSFKIFILHLYTDICLRYANNYSSCALSFVIKVMLVPKYVSTLQLNLLRQRESRKNTNSLRRIGQK